MGLLSAVQNSKIIDKLVDTLGLQTAVIKLPVDLVPNIQPVIDVIPDRIVNVIKSHGVAGTLFTTPTGADFFLTSSSIGVSDSNSTGNANARISVVLESGENQIINFVNLATGAASEDSQVSNQTFCFPIKLKRGSLIATTNTCDDFRATIQGYTIDIL